MLARPAAPATDGHPCGATHLPALRRDARRDASLCLLLLVALACCASALGPPTAWFVAKAVIVFAAACGFMLRELHRHAPHARFGAANRVTLGRLGLIALLAAEVGEPLVDPVTTAWAAIVVATTAALLDALDGPLARASGLASEFGARFDMESDALLVLVLCLLVLHFDKAGAWVVAAGLMRYAFVGAAWRWRWMARPLPPSQRRKAVCVAQITCLIVCLGPIIDTAWSEALAAVSLSVLTASFAIDVAWLRRHRHLPGEPEK
ncbi:CDP-alcohol phosphatidyltransferase family protein [Variovorax sp. J22R133]|uniref:CDP-alcohol phosphatidyltransferase family protein n=1 Tax=Variovorax brevis TaxID=3053503 RepID=UPI002574B030|nr:CDP-alcohol phosphatidyltransferase family protein [Variovorax sp. J22R133]MDM0111209.1 CDP-alcohol phosphatidyltransferase family protein [Variovorax sp. J22R133]